MPYDFLLHLGGALALLLWALHMVRSGVERGWGSEIAVALRWSAGRLRPAAAGAALAFALQSATAAGLLAAEFAGRGAMSASAGLAVMLGADLGSALVVYAYGLDLSGLAPAFLIAGAALFFRAGGRRWTQTGRAVIGLGLVFIAFGLLREATAPLRDSDLLPGAAAYLGRDLVAAFIAGAVVTWFLHSSVAAVLLLAMLAGHGILPFGAAVALLLGANLGGALIPFGLTRGAAPAARQIMAGNVMLRGGVALVALAGVAGGALALLPAGLGIIELHLGINAVTLIAGLPLAGLVARLAERLVRRTPEAAGERALGVPPSCLDPAALDDPDMAVGNVRRELIRMAEIVSRMLEPVMDIYATGDADKIREARAMEEAIDRTQREIKLYLARISFPAGEERQGADLAEIAVNLEHAGDAVTGTLLRLAEVRREQKLAFSPRGWRELAALHASVLTSMRLAQNVLVTRDNAQARKLVERKAAVRSLAEDSLREHMQRLREGTPATVATSNIHLETIRALRTINSLLATIGYHVLVGTGEVLDSRLKSAN